MYHSIRIIPDGYQLYAGKNLRGKNTWDDWHLIPKERPLFNPPAPKYNFLDLPGANGTVDLSDVLSNRYPVYEDRKGSIEFYVMNGYKEWYNAYSDIMNYCHGEKCKLILEDEPTYYYRGRVSVNAWRSEKDWSKIVLDYQLEPFKYELFDSTEPWHWDPFSFIDGVITNSEEWVGEDGTGFIVGGTGNTTVSKEIAVTRMPVCPVFSIKCTSGTVSASSKLTIKLYRYYSQGTYEMTTHTFTAPDNETHEVEYQDIVLINYNHRYAMDADNTKMLLKFSTTGSETFKVIGRFRRGIL